VIFVATKKCRTTNFISPFSFVAVFGSGIRDEKKSGSGINIPNPQHCLPVGNILNYKYCRLKKLLETLCRKDRELVMEGKLAPSEDFYKADKFHALHKRMDDIRKRADRKFSSTASASSLKRKSSSTKVQWQYLVHRLHIVPDPDVSNVPTADTSTAGPSEPEPEAKEPLQANGDLNHEVQGDRSEDLRRKKKSKESVVHSNPIYEAFENVEDVDDLYRLADTLIYSAYTDSMS
jgi:predicted nucleotidyltransferase